MRIRRSFTASAKPHQRDLSSRRSSRAVHLSALVASVVIDNRFADLQGEGFLFLVGRDEFPSIAVLVEIDAQHPFEIMAIDFAKWRLPPILEICFVQPSAARPDHESPQPSHLIRFAIGIVTAELLEMVVVAGQHQRGSTLVKPAVGGFHLLEFSPVAGFGTSFGRHSGASGCLQAFPQSPWPCSPELISGLCQNASTQRGLVSLSRSTSQSFCFSMSGPLSSLFSPMMRQGPSVAWGKFTTK